MIFLNNFQLMNEDEAKYDALCKILRKYTMDEHYPLGLFNPNFTGQRIEKIDFEDITILYGSNGSGKTTILNIIAEKLEAFRYKEYLQTEAFAYYIDNCQYEYDEKPLGLKFLASDDIFDHILTIRDENKLLKNNKIKEAEFHSKDYRDIFPNGVKLDFENKNEDHFKNLSRFCEARKKTKKQFVRSHAGEMQRQYSNGENALMFFDKEIGKNSLYLLDEPENSMSPIFQIELKQLIEDSVRYKNCQFIIVTHSPFILSLKNAKIYNLDENPVWVRKWYELENVKILYELLKQNREYFDI
jgi:predicted ATPase